MKSKKKYIFYLLGIMITGILFLEISPSYQETTMFFARTLTYPPLLFVGYIYIYYSTIDRKGPKIVTGLITLALYLVNLYVVYSVYVVVGELKIGAYLFIISFFIFLISLFITEKKEPSKEEKILQEQAKSLFIIGDYVCGIKADITSKLCSITYMENNQGLKILFPTDKEVISYDFLKQNINSIQVSNKMIMNEQMPTNNDGDSLLLATALFGMYGGFISNSGILESIDNYQKVTINKVYQIEINYVLDREKNKNGTIIINCKENPSTFFAKYNDIYTEKQ